MVTSEDGVIWGRELGPVLEGDRDPEKAAEPSTAEERAEIDAAVRQLDADTAAERESAETRLAELGPRAKEALQKAARDGSAEARLRAGKLLVDLERVAPDITKWPGGDEADLSGFGWTVAR